MRFIGESLGSSSERWRLTLITAGIFSCHADASIRSFSTKQLFGLQTGLSSQTEGCDAAVSRSEVTTTGANSSSR